MAHLATSSWMLVSFWRWYSSQSQMREQLQWNGRPSIFNWRKLWCGTCWTANVVLKRKLNISNVPKLLIKSHCDVSSCYLLCKNTFSEVKFYVPAPRACTAFYNPTHPPTNHCIFCSLFWATQLSQRYLDKKLSAISYLSIWIDSKLICMDS